MSDVTAPDRIYAHEAVDNGPCDGWDFEGTWHVDVGANGGIEYIRADIHAALQAENERLRDALRQAADEIDRYIWQEYPMDHPVHERYRQRDFDANPARAALK